MIKNENKNNLVRIDGEPYKTITQDAEVFECFEEPMDVVEERLTQG